LKSENKNLENEKTNVNLNVNSIDFDAQIYSKNSLNSWNQTLKNPLKFDISGSLLSAHNVVKINSGQRNLGKENLTIQQTKIF
jgi:hypothetical protein